MRIGIAGAGRIGAMHATTLRNLSAVDELVVFDVDTASAARVAGEVGARIAPSIEALLSCGLDGFLIATATHTHAELLTAALAAGIPTFCEKPIAGNLAQAVEMARLAAASEVPVHVGFQRRFDAGYRRLRDAVQGGELGFVHTIRAATHDQSPPHPSYLPASGGLFRDAGVHDFDILRFVTGCEVASVYAVGANKGEQFFTEAGDVDSAAAVLTLDDDTLVVMSVTRYNGAGHDIRMEAHGSKGAMMVGLDDSLAFRSAEPGVAFPPGPQCWSFLERFHSAYRAELAAFIEVAQGTIPSPCTVADALEATRTAEACTISRVEGRVVALGEILRA